ncbi:MAG: ChaN family lipoprotein [Deferribacterales bacterium]
MKKYLIFLLSVVPVLSFAAKDVSEITASFNPAAKTISGTVDGKEFTCSMQGDGHVFITDRSCDDMNISAYEMELAIPKRYTVVAESDRAVRTKKGYKISLEHADGFPVIAVSDSWKEKSDTYKGIVISTYFTGENDRFADSYLSKTKELLDTYLKIFGKYPYGRFSIADVPYPVGHALVSLTFISDRIVSMPFMLNTSLGHELFHQWMGVSVDTKQGDGNWAEGLTTYMADRLYSETGGIGAEYRKGALLNVMSNARQKEDGTCLLGFEYKKDNTSQAVGYSKSMMVFSMLEELSDDKFNDGLKLLYDRYKYSEASWDDIQKAFEQASGKDFGAFFDGWLAETALAEFDITDINVAGEANGFSVSFTVKNKYEWLNYPLEVIVKTDGKNIRKTIYISKKTEKFNILTADRPKNLIIDPEYRTARMIDSEEIYPTMYALFSKYPKAVFVNKRDMPKFSKMIEQIDKAVVYDDGVNPYQHTDKIMVFLGEENDAYKKLYDKRVTDSMYDFGAYALVNPLYPERTAYLISEKDADSIASNFSRVRHYGGYSAVIIGGGKALTRTDDASHGTVYDLTDDRQGVKVDRSLSLEDIVNGTKNSGVYYIGESHTSFAHHLNQLELVKQLVSAGKDVAIGLEMIQKPFQKYLDSYIKGDITEKEMLKKTEYYDRWRFDFRMYRPVFAYARENRIPLIALNAPAELTKKVSAGGIRSLTDAEVKELPEIRYTAGRYKDFLKGVFERHEKDNFENFYESQLLWDETMADSTGRYMKEHPEKTMVIMAGGGHIAYKEAIPERLFRRNGVSYTAIVQDEEPTGGVADYVLYPAEMEYASSPMIGVMLEEGSLEVKGFSDESPAGNASVKKGDILTEFNGTRLNALSDLKLELLYAEKGGTYDLTVMREGKAVKLKVTL